MKPNPLAVSAYALTITPTNALSVLMIPGISITPSHTASGRVVVMVDISCSDSFMQGAEANVRLCGKLSSLR